MKPHSSDWYSNDAEELRLVETINKMSNQIQLADYRKSEQEHTAFLTEVIEQLEDQLDSIRKNRQVSSHA